MMVIKLIYHVKPSFTHVGKFSPPIQNVFFRYVKRPPLLAMRQPNAYMWETELLQFPTEPSSADGRAMQLRHSNHLMLRRSGARSVE